MISYELKTGHRVERITLPDHCTVRELKPNRTKETASQEEICKAALENPMDAQPLRQLAAGKKRAVIVTSDITRPMPSKLVLPFILEQLYCAGMTDEQITIVLGIGSHRKHSSEEKTRLIGENVVRRLRVIDAGSDGYCRLGTTERGTPVEIDRTVSEADLRICLGNVEFHYFAGFSGGAKAILPGVSSPAAIRSNHRHMMEPTAAVGVLEGNPVREDMEEAVQRFCPVDFVLNVVLDSEKKILCAAAGHVVTAHRFLCQYLLKHCCVPLSGKADIVVASLGGAPKDMNLYQLQKGLENAEKAAKNGGVIILIGACQEGFGNDIFEQWMCRNESPQDTLERLQREFVLGGHKAAAICKVLLKHRVLLVSDLPEIVIRRTKLEPFSSAQEALDHALACKGRDAQILLIPEAGSTIPLAES